jgi:hypothetical protein
MKAIMMKKLLLAFTTSCLLTGAAFAAAFVGLRVQKEGGELQLINNATKAGFTERGGKNYWKVTYIAEPGPYTLIGTNPRCSVVTQSASFEEGKSYELVLTKDCRIESLTF